MLNFCPLKLIKTKVLNILTYLRFFMVSITLSVPEETRSLMKEFPEMNWSGFVRKCIHDKTKELKWEEQMLEKFKKEEKLTAWAVDLQRKARKDRYQHLKKKGLV
jgi:hypothetical protein